MSISNMLGILHMQWPTLQKHFKRSPKKGVKQAILNLAFRIPKVHEQGKEKRQHKGT